MITLPRPLLVALGAGFSAYHLVLGITTLPANADPGPVITSLVVYAIVTGLSLTVGRDARMPRWLAILNVAVGLGIAQLISSTRDLLNDERYGTWYIAAVGTLLTITAVRRNLVLAWSGAGLLTLQTMTWAGAGELPRLGLIGNLLWIAIAHLFTRVLERATRDVRQLATAEREAVDWQAAQDAHHYERQMRVAQTSRTALPMLERIAALEGELDAADRQECRVLEQSIRDEIRGRRLLNEAVRAEVMAARRRGAFVQVLDDGGVDDIELADLDPVLDKVAAALAGVQSDRIIIRTAPKGSAKAVTVVGLSSNDGDAQALGLDDEDEQVDLWLELDRPVGRTHHLLAER
jgi:hypothetical protein